MLYNVDSSIQNRRNTVGIGIVVSIVFLIAFAVIYLLMKLSCFLKNKYCVGENKLCNIMDLLMCESCRESCKNHKKLIIRAILFSAIIALSSGIVHYCTR